MGVPFPGGIFLPFQTTSDNFFGQTFHRIVAQNPNRFRRPMIKILKENSSQLSENYSKLTEIFHFLNQNLKFFNFKNRFFYRSVHFNSLTKFVIKQVDNLLKINQKGKIIIN